MMFVCQVDVGSVRNLTCVPVQDIEVLIDWFCAVIGVTVRFTYNEDSNVIMTVFGCTGTDCISLSITLSACPIIAPREMTE